VPGLRSGGTKCLTLGACFIKLLEDLFSPVLPKKKPIGSCLNETFKDALNIFFGVRCSKHLDTTYGLSGPGGNTTVSLSQMFLKNKHRAILEKKKNVFSTPSSYFYKAY
jgi:hypothetical protein